MFKKNARFYQFLTVFLVVAFGLFIAVSPAYGLNAFLKDWEAIYPNSASGDASCSVCHGTSTANLNAYGKDFCVSLGGSVPADVAPNIISLEGLDSDMDGSTNLEEILAGSQPGWTTGAVNQIYNAETCLPLGDPVSPPSNVPLPYDPPAGGDPVAIPGGPYTGNVNVPLTLDGSASYDSDATDVIVTYAWDFGDGMTGEGMTTQHTYTTAGKFTITLTVTDDEGMSSSNTTSVEISGSAVLDLDIAAFSVSSSVKVGKTIAIKLTVENPGAVLGQALATVTGTMNDTQVYSWTLNVYDYNGKGSTSFNFPSYKATAKGTIYWTVTIFDVDPDLDTASAKSVIK
jgi:hypothetical protein